MDWTDEGIVLESFPAELRQAVLFDENGQQRLAGLRPQLDFE